MHPEFIQQWWKYQDTFHFICSSTPCGDSQERTNLRSSELATDASLFLKMDMDC